MGSMGGSFYGVEKISSITLKIYEKLGCKLNKDAVSRLFDYYGSSKYFVILENYKLMVKPVFIEQKEDCKQLVNDSLLKDLPFLTLVFSFFSNPNKSNLACLINSVKTYNDEEKKFFIDALKSSCWLFTEIFKDDLALEIIIDKINNADFGNEKDWQEKEENICKSKLNVSNISLLQFSKIRSMTEGHNILEKFHTSFFISDDQNELLQFELIRIFMWTFFAEETVSSNVKKSINNNTKLRSDLFNSIRSLYLEETKKTAYDLRMILIAVISCFDSEFIFSNFIEINSLSEKIEFTDYTLYLTRDSRVSHMNNCIDKIITLLAMLEFNEKKCGFANLIPFIIKQTFYPINLNILKSIDFHLLSAKLIDASTKYAFSLSCLLVINPDISNEDVKRIMMVLDKSNENMMMIFLKIIEKINIKSNCEPLLNFIAKHVELMRYETVSLSNTIIKNFIESRPTNLQEISEGELA